jgi:hypothetical protein
MLWVSHLDVLARKGEFIHSFVRQDEFQIAYSDYEHRGADTAVGVSWIAPALTPRSKQMKCACILAFRD